MGGIERQEPLDLRHLTDGYNALTSPIRDIRLKELNKIVNKINKDCKR